MYAVLDRLTEYLRNHPDRVLMRWSGMIYREEDLFCRLDKLFLYLIYHEAGSVILRRIIGHLERPQNDEHYVLFTNGLSYRITEGERAGRVVPRSALMKDDCFEVSGVYKHLQYGKKPDMFYPTRKGDQDILALLETLWPESSPLPELQDMNRGERPFPKLYLSSKHAISSLNLRSSFLAKHAGVRDRAGLDRLHQECKKAQVDAGCGRVAYPHDMVYGRGVIVADDTLFGRWLDVDWDTICGGGWPDVRFKREVVTPFPI